MPCGTVYVHDRYVYVGGRSVGKRGYTGLSEERFGSVALDTRLIITTTTTTLKASREDWRST